MATIFENARFCAEERGQAVWYARGVGADAGEAVFQVVVLAGGLGTRMRPRTDAVPKLLLPVAGRPFAAWLLERLAQSGVREALMCVGHLGDAIRAALGDRFGGVSLRYAEDGPKLLGTAGALRGAVQNLAPAFVVTYGDAYLPFNYLAPLNDLQNHPEALGTLAVYRNEGHLDASNTAISGDRVLRYEKRSADVPPDPTLNHIDYGAMALRREVIEALPANTRVGLDTVQHDLAKRGVLRALLAGERFYEVGSAQGLSDLEALLGRGAGGVRP